MKMRNELIDVLNCIYGEKGLLSKVNELEKENEKLEGALKTGRNANQNLFSLIIGLTADNERLTEDNKKLAELNSKLYEENLKLTKDKQHLWEDVVTLKKNVDDTTQLYVEAVDDCYHLAGGYGEWHALVDYCDACSNRIYNDLILCAHISERAKDAMEMATDIHKHINMFKTHGERFYKNLKDYDDTEDGEDDE